MRVGVGRCQLDGGAVSGYSLGDATRLIENVAEIKVRQSIAGIGGHSLTVVLLALRKVPPVVIECAEIDVCGSVLGIDFQHLQVSADGLVVRAGMSFQVHAMREQLRYTLEFRNGLDLVRVGGNDGAHGSKIH